MHAAARELAADGRHVIVIGRPDHVEVRGITGDLQSFDVVASGADVRRWPHQKLGIVCQTTVPIQDARLLAQAIRAANPESDVRFVDTVCEPTKQRIAAVLRLLPRVDAMVVVGGKRSHNTRQLARLCEHGGVRVLHAQGVLDLVPEWFQGCVTVGLTAGTSTPDAIIDAVDAALRGLGKADGPA